MLFDVHACGKEDRCLSGSSYAVQRLALRALKERSGKDTEGG